MLNPKRGSSVSDLWIYPHTHTHTHTHVHVHYTYLFIFLYKIFYFNFTLLPCMVISKCRKLSSYLFLTILSSCFCTSAAPHISRAFVSSSVHGPDEAAMMHKQDFALEPHLRSTLNLPAYVDLPGSLLCK